LITHPDLYKRHDVVLFLHSKRAGHFVNGEAWRGYLLHTLTGHHWRAGACWRRFGVTHSLARDGAALGTIARQNQLG
jgi:hypothetical protein